jgi:hypothetical protein
MAGYALWCLAVLLSGLFASQIAGPYLHARMDRFGLALIDIAGPAWAVARGQGPAGCPAGGCAVRMVAAPIGYPGLGALNTGGGPAFLVAASPSGG